MFPRFARRKSLLLLILLRAPLLCLFSLLPLLSKPILLHRHPLSVLPTLLLTFPQVMSGEVDYAAVDAFSLPFFTHFLENSAEPYLSLFLSFLLAAILLHLSTYKRLKVLRIANSLPYPLICGLLSSVGVSLLKVRCSEFAER